MIISKLRYHNEKVQQDKKFILDIINVKFCMINLGIILNYQHMN